MRLLYVCSDFGIQADGTKGASIHVQSITRALCGLNHEVLLLSPHAGPGRDHPAQSLLAGRRCPAVRTSEQTRRYLKARGLPHQVAYDLRPLLYNAWVVPRVIKLLEKNPPDVIIERLSLLSHVGIDLAEKFACPLLIEANALLTTEARLFRQLELVALAQAMESRVLQRADAVMPVSRELADVLPRVGVKPSKVHVVPNGADVERFDPQDTGRNVRRRFGLGDSFVVGFAGSLKVWHGVDLLIAAFRKLLDEEPAARLLIVGSGPTENELRAMTDSLNMAPSVTFTGAVPHARIPEHLAAMDLAVAPFRKVDQFYFSPIKLFEYMAAGRCIIASRLGQIAEVIEPGRNGILCEPEDVEALAIAIVAARRADELRRRLGMQARRTAESDFSWNRAAQRVGRIAAQVLERRTRRKQSGPTPVAPGVDAHVIS